MAIPDPSAKFGCDSGVKRRRKEHPFPRPSSGADLRFVNADDIARERGISAYAAPSLAEALRRELVNQRESFVFETVFSDPTGDKLAFLQDVVAGGYNVILKLPKSTEEADRLKISSKNFLNLVSIRG